MGTPDTETLDEFIAQVPFDTKIFETFHGYKKTELK